MARPSHRSRQTVWVLSLLLREPGEWRHGYEIGKVTGLKSGTLYPILIRLADHGWLETRWVPPQREGRPARHAYRLTSTGRQAAAATVAEAHRRQPGARLGVDGVAG